MSEDSGRFRWEPWDGGTKPGRTVEPIRASDFVYVPGEYNRVQDGNGTEYTRSVPGARLGPHALRPRHDLEPGTDRPGSSPSRSTRRTRGAASTSAGSSPPSPAHPARASPPSPSPIPPTPRWTPPASPGSPDPTARSTPSSSTATVTSGSAATSVASAASTRKNLAKLDVSTDDRLGADEPEPYILHLLRPRS